MRLLFVENEDSFSWNVIDLLPFDRSRIELVTTAAAREAVARLGPGAAVVVGPGPKDPLRTGLVEVVRSAAERKLPLLGICLGCQALGLAFGARLVRASPVHGKRWDAEFASSRLFPGVEGRQQVMRYHSLALEQVESPLRLVAATAEGVPMAIEHEQLPMAGLQFHPDSFATPRGRQMVESFFGAVA
jgi:anthranilate synthase component 2